MKNQSSPLILFLIALITFGGLAYFYWASHNTPDLQNAKLTEDLHQLVALNSEWNADILRNTDDSKSAESKVFFLQARIASELSNLGYPARDNLNADLKQLLSKKSELVSSFKAQSRELTNTLTRFPTEAAQLQQMTSDSKTRKPTLILPMNTLGNLANNLMAVTLQYDLVPSRQTKDGLQQVIASMNLIKPGFTPEIGTSIDTLVADAHTIVRDKDGMTDLADQIEALNPESLVQQIQYQMRQGSGEHLGQQQNYRYYSLGYAILLLLFLAYLIHQFTQSVRLAQQANLKLNQANVKLDEMVAVRTEMVTLAMDELKESQVQLVHSEKMASIGQMVAGVTHEINTPLSYVKSGLEIAITRIRDISELVEESTLLNTMLQSGEIEEDVLGSQLQRIGSLANTLTEEDMINELESLLKDGLHGISQISEIIVSLKNFSRLDREKITRFDVHEGLESTLKIAKNIVKNKHIIKQYGENISHINCSPSAINQVFLNLITNAAQATGKEGEIRIITSQDKQFVKVDIIDNGSGIAPNVLDKIFDPFFTTKQAGEGTGLGLSIVQRIVREHGGEISVKSKVGLGTKFTVQLPVDLDTSQTLQDAHI